MAKGSERFAFRHYPEVARECAHCGRRLRVEDVGRVHTHVTYGPDRIGRGVTRFYCTQTQCRHEGYGA
jgi:hypothetical protein